MCQKQNALDDWEDNFTQGVAKGGMVINKDGLEGKEGLRLYRRRDSAETSQALQGHEEERTVSPV